MKRMGIPDEAAVCPHDPRDPTGVSLISIDDPLMLAILELVLNHNQGDQANRGRYPDLCQREESVQAGRHESRFSTTSWGLLRNTAWLCWCSSMRTGKAKHWAGG